MDPQEQMQNMLLEQLRDIQLPQGISWWPLAPGWWVLAGLVLCVVAGIAIFLLRRHALNRYRREAAAELKKLYEAWNVDQETDQYLVNASRILRQVAVHICGREAVSSSTGNQWMEHMARMSTRPVPETLRSALTIQAYQPNPRVNIDQAHQDIIDWLEGVSVKQYRQAAPYTGHSKEAAAHV